MSVSSFIRKRETKQLKKLKVLKTALNLIAESNLGKRKLLERHNSPPSNYSNIPF
jgi:hypothetical protein